MGTVTPTYTATVTVTGGRAGHAVSDDGVLDVQLRRPKVRGENEGTNPEQLFAAAWGACYQSALISVGRDAGIDTAQSTVTVRIGVGPDEGGGYGLVARIEIAIPGVDREEVQRLADGAHRLCPYSRAT